ncbi:hypothetical protein BV898_19046 [Hypsibius exemplaris]|uniref:Uncharacterized protein n=1 Tax=Hypsibius exemplaris TaxID=2072580 RepID=A0A9X6NIU5_HYPEX|nr:hypothetical protein BV898_19046 [Hypsibius exemplaris]
MLMDFESACVLYFADRHDESHVKATPDESWFAITVKGSGQFGLAHDKGRNKFVITYQDRGYNLTPIRKIVINKDGSAGVWEVPRRTRHPRSAQPSIGTVPSPECAATKEEIDDV